MDSPERLEDHTANLFDERCKEILKEVLSELDPTGDPLTPEEEREAIKGFFDLFLAEKTWNLSETEQFKMFTRICSEILG